MQQRQRILMTMGAQKPYDISWSRRGDSLLKSGVFSDVRIRVDNSIYNCHKIVLASASEFFEKLFEKEGLTKDPVVISETTPKIFGVFLKYIYTWNDESFTGLELTDLLSLFKSSHMWMAAEVEKTCARLINNLSSSMQPNDLIKLFAASHLLDNNSIMENVIKLLRDHYSPQIDSPEALNMGIDCFSEYFKRTNQSLQLCRKFSLAEKWIQKNAPQATVSYSTNTNINQNNSTQVSLLEKLALIIQSIDFQNMSLDEFYNGPGKSKVLTDSSKVEIIYKIASRGGRRSYY